MVSKIIMYTDGACSGNPGPGGWGAVLISEQLEQKLYGGSPYTTNNQMELTAVIKGLEVLLTPQEIDIFTDSEYVRRGITEWIKKWKVNQWKTSDKKDVKNKDLWLQLENAIHFHKINWFWVKGHSGNIYNELADMLARKGCSLSKQKC